MELTIKVVAKFDHKAVKKAEDRAARSSMIKQLAFIRRRARSSIRRRKKPSGPGQIPKAHAASGNLSLKTIFFNLEETSKGPAGHVGPVKLNQVPFVKQETTVPNALEQGGRYRVLEEEVSLDEDTFRAAGFKQERTGRIRHKDGRIFWWRRVDKRLRGEPGRPRRWRGITIKPRPFMIRALEAEIEAGTIMAPWHNSFHA